MELRRILQIYDIKNILQREIDVTDSSMDEFHRILNAESREGYLPMLTVKYNGASQSYPILQNPKMNNHKGFLRRLLAWLK